MNWRLISQVLVCVAVFGCASVAVHVADPVRAGWGYSAMVGPRGNMPHAVPPYMELRA